MYAFKDIEAALAPLHNVGATSASAFRGRLKNFQRIGLVPSSPGRGKRIEYSFEDACMWGFALELSEFGIDPLAIKAIIDFSWQHVFNEGLRLKAQSAAPIFFVADPRTVSRRDFWRQFFFIVGPAYRSWPKPEKAGRALIVNLTAVGLALRTALAVDPNEALPPSQYAANRAARVQEILAGVLDGSGDESPK